LILCTTQCCLAGNLRSIGCALLGSPKSACSCAAPGYQIALFVSDSIEVKKSRSKGNYFKEQKDLLSSMPDGYWLTSDIENWTAEVLRMPEQGEMDDSFDPALIVEYYSKLV